MAANPPQKHEAFYYYSSGRCWCNECIESGGRAKKERTKKNSSIKNRRASRAEDKDLPGLGFS